MTDRSGAKNSSARASCCMRGPSRQTTARLTAGGFGRAATARARSETTRPSAPSVTLARVSARPGLSSSAGDLAGDFIRGDPRGNDLMRSNELGPVFRPQQSIAAQSGVQIGIRHLDEVFQIGQFGVGKLGDGGVGEAAENRDPLAGAAMPAAKQQPLAAVIEAVARSCRSRHLSFPSKRQKPGRAGRG